MQPQATESVFKQTIKGKIRITTRCLWLDNGKLLDALHSAAHAALSGCPVKSSMPHIERIVSEVLRKIVRKYSGKRPEVITHAIENPAAVVADEISGKLSGVHQGFEIPFGQTVFGSPKKKWSSNIQESKNPDLPMGWRKTKGDATNDDGMLSKEEIATPSNSTGSSVPNSVSSNALSKSHKKSESVDEPEDGNKGPKTDKPLKRNRWKPEEIKKLIKYRGELHSRFQVVKGRMALWEEISVNLCNEGSSRSPSQCKSLWASLIQKYEESKNEPKSERSWQYYEEMDNILSVMVEK